MMKVAEMWQKLISNSKTAKFASPETGTDADETTGERKAHRLPSPLQRLRRFFRIGDPWIWACAACTAVVLLLFFMLIAVVAIHGLSTYWAPDLVSFQMKDGSRLIGAINAEDEKNHRVQLYIGNRDLYGLDYRWVDHAEIEKRTKPDDLVILERVEKGNFIGMLRAVNTAAESETRDEGALWSRFRRTLATMNKDLGGLAKLQDSISDVNWEMERLRLDELKAKAKGDGSHAGYEARQLQKRQEFDKLAERADALRNRLRQRTVTMEDARGNFKEIAVMDIVRAYPPNRMTLFQKIGLYFDKIRELLTANPRESNTEGGLFPAIFGTVLMVFLMSLFGVPLGVVAAVYLREYAKEGILVNLVRIAVNNLAGVPSIVYGIFGLGFFVYGIGGGIDRLFFAERLPIPTFGTGGLLWASLTMALLTVPVVIVSTEEGLNSVPQGVRDGSLALGATKLQTLLRVVMPMATPGILTGLILSIARAAGEVAPLMLVGVVKIVPSLPVEDHFPFIHLERKFMHLGFHIFDVGFQSPNVEAAMPMVYVTTLLLLTLVLGMSFLAMYLRNSMKKRYMTGAF